MTTTTTTTSLDILRWDGLIESKASIPRPGLYVHATPELLSIADTHIQIPIKITDTDSLYQQELAYAYVRKSEYTGGYRPNFQAQTHTLVILPDIEWKGYPLLKGRVHILQSIQTDDSQIDDWPETHIDIEHASPPATQEIVWLEYFWWMIMMMIIVCGILSFGLSS